MRKYLLFISSKLVTGYAVVHFLDQTNNRRGVFCHRFFNIHGKWDNYLKREDKCAFYTVVLQQDLIDVCKL